MTGLTWDEAYAKKSGKIPDNIVRNHAYIRCKTI